MMFHGDFENFKVVFHLFNVFKLNHDEDCEIIISVVHVESYFCII